MSKGICIDRERTIGHLKMLMADNIRNGAAYLNGVGDAIDVVCREHRVNRDIGVCVWTQSQDGEGMVHYET